MKSGLTYFCATVYAKRDRYFFCALNAASRVARSVGSARAVLAARAAVLSASCERMFFAWFAFEGLSRSTPNCSFLQPSPFQTLLSD